MRCIAHLSVLVFSLQWIMLTPISLARAKVVTPRRVRRKARQVSQSQSQVYHYPKEFKIMPIVGQSQMGLFGKFDSSKSIG